MSALQVLESAANTETALTTLLSCHLPSSTSNPSFLLPIRQASGDANLYPIVQNNPVNRTDPSGHRDNEIDIKNGTIYQTYKTWLGPNGTPRPIAGVGEFAAKYGVSDQELIDTLKSTYLNNPKGYDTAFNLAKNSSLYDLYKGRQKDDLTSDDRTEDSIAYNYAYTTPLKRRKIN